MLIRVLSATADESIALLLVSNQEVNMGNTPKFAFSAAAVATRISSLVRILMLLLAVGFVSTAFAPSVHAEHCCGGQPYGHR